MFQKLISIFTCKNEVFERSLNGIYLLFILFLSFTSNKVTHLFIGIALFCYFDNVPLGAVCLNIRGFFNRNGLCNLLYSSFYHSNDLELFLFIFKFYNLGVNVEGVKFTSIYFLSYLLTSIIITNSLTIILSFFTNQESSCNFCNTGFASIILSLEFISSNFESLIRCDFNWKVIRSFLIYIPLYMVTTRTNIFIGKEPKIHIVPNLIIKLL